MIEILDTGGTNQERCSLYTDISANRERYHQLLEPQDFDDTLAQLSQVCKMVIQHIHAHACKHTHFGAVGTVAVSGAVGTTAASGAVGTTAVSGAVGTTALPGAVGMTAGACCSFRPLIPLPVTITLNSDFSPRLRNVPYQR